MLQKWQGTCGGGAAGKLWRIGLHLSPPSAFESPCHVTYHAGDLCQCYNTSELPIPNVPLVFTHHPLPICTVRLKLIFSAIQYTPCPSLSPPTPLPKGLFFANYSWCSPPVVLLLSVAQTHHLPRFLNLSPMHCSSPHSTLPNYTANHQLSHSIANILIPILLQPQMYLVFPTYSKNTAYENVHLLAWLQL